MRWIISYLEDTAGPWTGPFIFSIRSSEVKQKHFRRKRTSCFQEVTDHKECYIWFINKLSLRQSHVNNMRYVCADFSDQYALKLRYEATKSNQDFISVLDISWQSCCYFFCHDDSIWRISCPESRTAWNNSSPPNKPLEQWLKNLLTSHSTAKKLNRHQQQINKTAIMQMHDVSLCIVPDGIALRRISLIKAFAVCLGFLSRDTIEFSKESLMKELLHFHYHYRHENNKLMIGARECSRRLSHMQSHLCRRGSRGRCVETCPWPSPAHVWTEVWLPSVWACITRSPKEEWFEHDLIRQNKRQEWSSGEREREREGEEAGRSRAASREPRLKPPPMF